MSSHGTMRAQAPARSAWRREDWLTDGLLSGFLATFAMTLVLFAAYGMSSAIGRADGNTLEQWFWGLTNNLVTGQMGNQVVVALAANLAVGLVLAMIYAYVAEPMLRGAGWQRGILFALIPWVLSILIFFPIIGGGVLGLGLMAGVLPMLGNLILHVVYGAVLGTVYAITVENGIENTELERRNAANAERGAAAGVVVGLILGLVGGWLLAPQLGGDFGPGAVMIAGALIGGAGGLAAGSFLGMGAVRNTPSS